MINFFGYLDYSYVEGVFDYIRLVFVVIQVYYGKLFYGSKGQRYGLLWVFLF